MITAQLKATATLIILFLTVAIAAKAIGTLQPPNPARRGFIEGCEDKPQPCWYGIVPGVTMPAETDTILKNLGYQRMSEGEILPIYSTSPQINNPCLIILHRTDTTLHYLRLIDCFEVKIGDLAGFLISPQRLSTTVNYSDRKNAEVMIDDTTLSWATWTTSLFDQFTAAFLLPSDSSASPKPEWHGFVLQWRYCQLEPEHPGCSA